MAWAIEADQVFRTRQMVEDVVDFGPCDARVVGRVNEQHGASDALGVFRWIVREAVYPELNAAPEEEKLGQRP